MKHRTQVLIEPKHHAYLQREARARQCSLSGALRCLLDERMSRDARRLPAAEDPVLKAAGTFRSGHSDTAARDEEFLYGGQA
jgi:hypothetical protein